MGSGLKGEVPRRRLTHRTVGDRDHRSQASVVRRTVVQGVGGVQGGAVRGIKQSGASQLDRGHVDGTDDEQESDERQPEDEHADLAPLGINVRGTQQMVAGPAHAIRRAQGCWRHCPPNRSTVATWVTDTGIRIGTIPEKNAGTSGIGTETVAVIRTRPAGRRQGVP